MSFFKQFPTTQYDFGKADGAVRNIVNIFKHVAVRNVGLDGIQSYSYYDVQAGDRPDNVSTRLYGTPDYYWTFFILNSSLKGGLRNWPKSEQELDRYIGHQYDGYKMGLAIPYTETNQQITLNNNTTFETYTKNTFNGLDMTHPYLRVRKYESNSYALVDSWNPELFQLTVRNVHDSSDAFYIHSAVKNDGTINGRNQFFIETYNPYDAGDSNYSTVEALNQAWRRKFKTWTQNHRPELWANWSALDPQSPFYTAGLSESAADIQFEAWMKTSFRVSLYALYDGRNAPHHYVESIGSTERVSAQNALIQGGLDTDGDGVVDVPDMGNLYNINPSLAPFQSNVEYEREQNEALQRIRVVKKQYIQEFAEAYKDLLNE